MARLASSSRTTPLRTFGPSHWEQSHSASDQSKPWSIWLKWEREMSENVCGKENAAKSKRAREREREERERERPLKTWGAYERDGADGVCACGLSSLFAMCCLCVCLLTYAAILSAGIPPAPLCLCFCFCLLTYAAILSAGISASSRAYA